VRTARCRYARQVFFRLHATTANDGRCFCSSSSYGLTILAHVAIITDHYTLRLQLPDSFYLAIFGSDCPAVISRTFRGN